METSRALTSFMWYVLTCAQCYGANTLQAFGGRSANLNLDKLIVSGYSVGAQMSSWFVQLQATGQLQGAGDCSSKNAFS